MKAGIVFFVAIFLGLTLCTSKVNGQMVAIGHVSAEVIESISATSATNSDFQLTKSTGTVSADMAAEALNLGAITLQSGKDFACNVVFQSAALTNSEGNGFTIKPSADNDLISSRANEVGNQTIQLTGTTTRSNQQAAGLYEGSYTVVFAFN